MNKVINTVFYIRVSTDRQAKEGDSLEAQQNALEEYAKKNHLKVVNVYVDGGESGQKLKRTNLQKMLSDIEKGGIDLVIMTKLDRWFRNVADFYKVLEVLKRNKVDWKTIWEDYETSTASGQLWLNMSLALGQMEAQRTSERIRETFNYKMKIAKEVCTGTHIYGYDVVDKHLVPNEEEAIRLNELYDKYLECNSINLVTKWWNSKYDVANVRSIKNRLQNTAYIGKYKSYNDELIEDFSPPLIDEDKFNKVQDKLKMNVKIYPQQIKKTYIFSGMLYCPECHSRLSSKYACPNKYYVCKKAKINLCSNHLHVNESKLEEYLLNNINKLYKELELSIKDSSNKNNLKDNKIKLKNLKSQESKILDLYMSDLISKDDYSTKYNAIKEQIEALEKELKDYKEIDISSKIEYLKGDWKAVYNGLSELEKRELWSTLFKGIELSSLDNIKFIL